MDVGINYPWFDYGWDFGEAPLGWRSTSEPRWYSQIDGDLQHLRYLGISVVRWFILADGLTYGTGDQAPHLDTNPRRTGQWRFDEPPALSDSIQVHFRTLLERFESANQTSQNPIRLLPVLIDFQFCQPGRWAVWREDESRQQTVSDPGWVKQGRADVVRDAQKRQRFFVHVLEPLLRISQEHRNMIFAWELINEPEWVTNSWHPDRDRQDLPVNARDMASFLNDGIRRIHAARFKATVGFNRIETILMTRIHADYNQFHHYPRGRRRLARHRFDRRFPGIIGEFATSTNNDIWPELISTGQDVLNRLRYIESLGYPLALPWSYRQRDDLTSWDLQTEQNIECFTMGRNCPRASR